MPKLTLRFEGTAADAKALGLPAPDPAKPSMLDKLESASLTTTGRVRLAGMSQPLDVEIVLDLK